MSEFWWFQPKYSNIHIAYTKQSLYKSRTNTILIDVSWTHQIYSVRPCRLFSFRNRFIALWKSKCNLINHSIFQTKILCISSDKQILCCEPNHFVLISTQMHGICNIINRIAVLMNDFFFHSHSTYGLPLARANIHLRNLIFNSIMWQTHTRTHAQLVNNILALSDENE